jgi:DnaJ-class molecular chaperone
MAEDYYKILGVEKNATDDQIKHAYRKLAKQHHPDKGGNKDVFQQIQNAYDTLSDPVKRSQYDSPMSQAFPGFPGGGGFGFDMSDIVNNMFGGGGGNNLFKRNVKKEDVYHICKIKLSDVYFGTTKKFNIKRDTICEECIINCSTCNGKGVVQQQIQMGPFIQISQSMCTGCNGSKTNKKTVCDKCNSNGFINEQRLIEIDIYKGIENDTEFVFSEWGKQATNKNETSGNLIVKVQIEPDLNFKREGMNLIYTQNLTLKESIIGKTFTVPHFDGEFVQNTRNFGIIDPSKTYVMKNKGIDAKGNLCFKFTITYPGKKLTDEEIKIIDSINF